MSLTVNEVLTIILTGMMGVLAYFLKRFVDTVYGMERRINDHGERLAGLEAHLGVIPRRRRGDR